MNRLIISTLFAAATGGFLVAEFADVADQVVPAAAEQVATSSIEAVAAAAYYEYVLGTPWPDAIADATYTARRNHALTVDGTTLTWDDGVGCFTAELTDPETEPAIKACQP